MSGSDEPVGSKKSSGSDEPGKRAQWMKSEERKRAFACGSQGKVSPDCNGLPDVTMAQVDPQKS